MKCSDEQRKKNLKKKGFVEIRENVFYNDERDMFYFFDGCYPPFPIAHAKAILDKSGLKRDSYGYYHKEEMLECLKTNGFMENKNAD